MHLNPLCGVNLCQHGTGSNKLSQIYRLLLQSTVKGGAYRCPLQSQLGRGHISLGCRKRSLGGAELRLAQKQIVGLAGAKLTPLSLRLQVTASLLRDALCGGRFLSTGSGDGKLIIRLFELQQDVSYLEETPVKESITHALHFSADLCNQSDAPDRLYGTLSADRNTVVGGGSQNDIHQRATRLRKLGWLGLRLTH